MGRRQIRAERRRPFLLFWRLVGRRPALAALVRERLHGALAAAYWEALKAKDYPTGGTVSDKLTDNVATIGENQQVRRMKTVSVTNGVIVPYLHNAVAPDLGKIGGEQ